jgi:hypothetical protein
MEPPRVKVRATVRERVPERVMERERADPRRQGRWVRGTGVERADRLEGLLRPQARARNMKRSGPLEIVKRKAHKFSEKTISCEFFESECVDIIMTNKATESRFANAQD